MAYLTDIHVQPESKAGEGMAQALRHVQNQKDKVDMIWTGGDLIMDAFGAGFDRATAQWDVFSRVLKAECSLPVRHALGNHDVWGWDKRESNPAHAAKSGKKWACEVLGLKKPYESFQRAGWKFITLDSTFPAGGGYTARLDDEQFAWLETELAGTPSGTYVVVNSHIPICTVTSFYETDRVKDGNWNVPGSWMHIDARKIQDLFRKYPNVKGAMSGHMHQVDRVEFMGVAYLCAGAVSGAWWGGDYYACSPGYMIVNLYNDGSIEEEYVAWGWKKE